MMGFALRINWLIPHEKMTNIYINKNSESYQYQALAWNYRKPDSPVLQVDLGKNHGQAIK